MKIINAVFVFTLVLFCVTMGTVYSQLTPVLPAAQIKTADVNKDGKPDVTYQSQGEYVSRIEADTNYDGKPDVIVHLKDGKFESAEADTNYDGEMDKKFTNETDFSKWLNDNHPDFNDKLCRNDWQFTLLSF